jgi:HSP20 family protein
MWTRLSDFDRLLSGDEFDRTFGLLDQFRRRANRLFEDLPASGQGVLPQTGWPRTQLYDNGAELVVAAEVPGLSEKDIQVNINQDMLTLSGERLVDPPEGYSVQRRERAPVRFSRTFTLPCRVDAEKSGATVSNGILTVTLTKAPESQPRQIAVKALK